MTFLILTARVVGCYNFRKDMADCKLGVNFTPGS